jgi:hypothetical protein
VDGEDGRPGGAETDIRSLFYWSRSAFYILVAAGVLWIALGAWRLYSGLVWMDLDASTGSTQAESDVAWGITYCAAAIFAFLLARLIRNDILVIFSSRRFTVPREKLLLYSMLALPFGFILPGVLLILVNVKLSNPEFLPSHAEAYPEMMPGFIMMPTSPPAGGPAEEELTVPEDVPRELAPLGFESVPVSEEEAQPAPEFMGELPPGAEMEQVPAPGTPLPQAPMAAYVEEVPEGEIPEAVVTVAPAAPAPAIIEEIPMEEIPEVVAAVAGPPPAEAQPAVVEAYVEEVPGEGEVGEFELVEELPSEGDEEELPRDTKEAHDQLMAKLLGK